MKWSWKIGTYAGIDVFMHATFLLIIGWVGFSYWQQTRTLVGTLEGIVFTLILFGFVVLHEYGHALTPRRYGIKTRDITLYPIGGVARLERLPDKPIQEFWVALAGPAVNGLIVDNLVSNAVKFTPDGGTITVRAKLEGADLRLDVADTGPGIAPDDRARIFEAFYQGAVTPGGLVHGTGIGLSVVQEFVQAHGGTIEMVDGEFPGAHFRVRLPAEGATAVR